MRAIDGIRSVDDVLAAAWIAASSAKQLMEMLEVVHVWVPSDCYELLTDAVAARRVAARIRCANIDQNATSELRTAETARVVSRAALNIQKLIGDRCKRRETAISIASALKEFEAAYAELAGVLGGTDN